MPKSKSASPETQKKPRKAAKKPTNEEIALHAYHIYLKRGSTPGDPMQDWIQAERELSEALKKTSKRKSKIVSIAA
jgi:Protein of unknown function (DUF2934)